MKLISKLALAAATLLPATLNAGAAIEGSLDPPSVVAEWSNSSTYPKIIDINFSDEMWPGQTWTGETGMDCPEYADGGYVNTVIEVPANGGTEIKYPVLFHNCIFANKNHTTAMQVPQQHSAVSTIWDRTPQEPEHILMTGLLKDIQNISKTT